MSDHSSGQLAYNAYARAKGLDARPWEDLSDEDRHGWQLVAEAADQQAPQPSVDTAELLDTEASPATVDDVSNYGGISVAEATENIEHNTAGLGAKATTKKR